MRCFAQKEIAFDELNFNGAVACRTAPVLFNFCALTLLIWIGLSSCTRKNAPFFKLLNPEETGLDFGNFLAEDDSLNIIQYLYFFNGGGVAVGDVNNDNLPDIYFSSNRLPNRLFINKGRDAKGIIRFADVTESAGVGGTGNWATGVSFVDINHDGWLDIYACYVGGYKSLRGRNQLFINQGCRDQIGVDCDITFAERAQEYGLDFSGFSSQAAFFDYDLDGDLDMYLLCHSVHSTESYRDTASSRKPDRMAGDKLFENLGDGGRSNGYQFHDVTEAAGIIAGIAGYGLGISIGDLDKNGYPDIYVGNDFHENDFLYLNQGNGQFIESSLQLLGHSSYFSMGNEMADVNNDGWLDIMTLDMKSPDEPIYKSAQGPDPYDIYRFKRAFGYHHQFPQNALQISLGKWPDQQIRFSEVAAQIGIEATDWSWSTIISDLNLDGHKDFYITNGIPRRPNDLDYLKFISNQSIQQNATDQELSAQMPNGVVSNLIFANQNGTFTNMTRQWGMNIPSISHGAAVADFDLDGDPDIVVSNLNDNAFYFENRATETTEKHFLKVRFKGPENNPFGLGSAVTLYLNGGLQYQELYPVKGWLSNSDYCLIFGLGDATLIDSLLVRWPQGEIQVLKNITSNKTVILDFDKAVKGNVNTRFSESSKEAHIFQDLSENSIFSHRENHFYDNNREPLIPYLLSTQGPKVAVADVNKDQLIDFFIGGAIGQPGAIVYQNASGYFSQIDSNSFMGEKWREDTDAAFLDVDQDGDQDLYIGSGGNQYYREDTALLDRLYINDGFGHFILDTSSLPKIFEQTSCVRPFDFDGDGDLDIFVGSRSTAVLYGKPPDSHLLVNDGSGKFTQAAENIIELANAGMITDAAWSDLNNDGFIDLVVVGDWIPVTVYSQKSGIFTKQIIPNTSGWYNCIKTADLDSDGDMDLVIGNFGTNSNLKASPAAPVSLYLSDYDQNLTPDPILTYYKNGQEYPVMGLDALGAQLVYLKKTFRSYQDFSTKKITEIFSEPSLSKAAKSSIVNLHSIVAFNDGHGQFTMQQLPDIVQRSAVFAIEIYDFNYDQIQDILLAGNFFDIQPAIGRLDGGFGTLLLGDGRGGFTVANNIECNLRLEGQVRDMAIIESAAGPALIVAKNNLPVQYLEINRPK